MDNAKTIIVTFIALILLGYLLNQKANQNPNTIEDKPEEMGIHVVELITQEDCDVKKGCFALRGTAKSISLKLLEPAVALKPFKVKAFASKDLIDPTISLTMKGMDMGVHKYKMLPEGKKAWVAEITLPICTTGRTDWTAEITGFEKEGRVWRAEFPLLLLNEKGEGEII